MSDASDPRDGPEGGNAADAPEAQGLGDPTAEPTEGTAVWPEESPASADLRPGADSCYKCTSCDSSCPVAEVDDDFPGPKFQGPEQWRLKRGDDRQVDDSIAKCSNCMRCDDACPTDVPLSQMHNTARAEYVEESVSRFSRDYLRRKLLANYGRLSRLGARVPRLTNAIMGSSVTQWLNEKLLGITSEREFPTFADETFRAWWRDRGGAQVEDADKRVAYFHGDYANANTPAVGKALVRVFEHYGYEVAVPEQRCSGTPMFANGMLDDARRAARVNVERLAAHVAEGYDVVCSCTSCSLALRQEYPELFDLDGVDAVAAHTHEALEYLRIHEDVAADLADASADVPDLAYHAPCHARNQGLDRQAVELLGDVSGPEVTDVGDSCSGISGTYGWKTEHYDTSMAIGEEMFAEMAAAPAETGLTECPTCAMQMSHGTGYDVRHPLEVIEAALVA